MNRKIKFENENKKRSNTITYEIINNDLKRLKDWDTMRREIVFNINRIMCIDENSILISAGLNEIKSRLNEMLDIMDVIIDTEKENICLRCPSLKEFIY